MATALPKFLIFFLEAFNYCIPLFARVLLLVSLKSFYFNRYILELEFETLNFILGELIVSIPNLYNVINTIKKENNDRKILVRNVNNIRILINKIVLLIVISFSNDDKEDNDDFTCNNKEYNLNFFTSNKKNALLGAKKECIFETPHPLPF